MSFPGLTRSKKMVRNQNPALGSLSICTASYPPRALALTRRIVVAALVTFLIGFAAASPAPAQERERPSEPQERERASQPQEHERASDWATDNLDRVSASVAQIRDVLAKDPGLMVELKRLLAKQATEKGQIVTEQDMVDLAILDRLENDPRFRALATRLLQRYGYLTPQVNTQSPEGQEQDLVRKARAARIARAATDMGPESGPSVATSYPIQVPASQPTPRPNPAPPVLPGTETLPPDLPRPDLTAPSLLTASAVSPIEPAKSNSQPALLRSQDIADVTGGMPA